MFAVSFNYSASLIHLCDSYNLKEAGNMQKQTHYEEIPQAGRLCLIE